MIPIALAELRMLVRNRLVAVIALVMPLGIGAVLAFRSAPGAGGTVAALQLAITGALGVYVGAATTLASRRQTLFLKRLRSGAVADASIIGGLVLPIVAVALAQLAIVFAMLGATAGAPAHPWLLAVGAVTTLAMFVALALATAGVTNSPEHAQVTTLPVFVVTLGATVWMTFTGSAELGWLKRALPGGSNAELMTIAWAGGDPAEGLLLALPTLGWALAAVIAARVMFRWEPRI